MRSLVFYEEKFFFYEKIGTNWAFFHYASVFVTYTRTSLLIFSLKNSGKTIKTQVSALLSRSAMVGAMMKVHIFKKVVIYRV